MRFKKTEFGKLGKGQIFSLNAVDRDVHGDSYAEIAEKIDENHYRRIGGGSCLVQCSTSKVVYLEV